MVHVDSLLWLVPALPLLGFLINVAAALLFLRVLPALLPEETPRLVRIWTGLIGLAPAL